MSLERYRIWYEHAQKGAQRSPRVPQRPRSPNTARRTAFLRNSPDLLHGMEPCTPQAIRLRTLPPISGEGNGGPNSFSVSSIAPGAYEEPPCPGLPPERHELLPQHLPRLWPLHPDPARCLGLCPLEDPQSASSESMPDLSVDLVEPDLLTGALRASTSGIAQARHRDEDGFPVTMQSLCVLPRLERPRDLDGSPNTAFRTGALRPPAMWMSSPGGSRASISPSSRPRAGGASAPGRCTASSSWLRNSARNGIIWGFWVPRLAQDGLQVAVLALRVRPATAAGARPGTGKTR